MANEKSNRLGNHGSVELLTEGCNSDLGNKGLVVLTPEIKGVKGTTEYISNKNNSLDIQLNIEKLGKVFQDGLDNTKEMAEKWNWHKDNNELNWRDTPCSLRVSYDQKAGMLRIQVWNELIQTWARLSLTKEQILKIIEG